VVYLVLCWREIRSLGIVFSAGFPMRTFVIDSEAEWERWRAPWDSLVTHNPMGSMEWLVPWWHSFGNGHRLHVVAVTHGTRLVGVLPCYESVSPLGNQLHFLGSGDVSSDYLTAFVDTKCASEVYEQLACHFSESPLADRYQHLTAIRFEGIAGDDPWMKRLGEISERTGCSFREKTIVNSWRLRLPDSWDEFVASQRGRGAQRKAKRSMTRIASGEVITRKIDSVDGLEEAMGHLIRLHQARRQSLGDAGCFSDARFETFLRNAIKGLMAKRQAKFELCEVKGAVIGIQLYLQSAEGTFMYQSGVDPAFMEMEPGHVLIAAGIKQAIADKRRFYDFLRGDEPYKEFWGALPIPLKRVTLTPPTFKALTMDAVCRHLRWVRSCYQSFGAVSALGGMMAIT
jgi:CelD/BcsL family acetyltransferase involved in cellulose biosynthesis